MKKAKIYKPTKSAMQSGNNNSNKWIIEFITERPGINPLMGWESSNDTYSELKLEFSSKELAISYAQKMKIDYEIIEPKKRNPDISLAKNKLNWKPKYSLEKGLLKTINYFRQINENN